MGDSSARSINKIQFSSVFFECSSYVEGSLVSCSESSIIQLSSVIKTQLYQAIYQLRRELPLIGIQGGPHLVSCSESGIIKLYQALYQGDVISSVMSEGALIFERSSYVEGSRCMGFRVYLTLFLVQNQA